MKLTFVGIKSFASEDELPPFELVIYFAGFAYLVFEAAREIPRSNDKSTPKKYLGVLHQLYLTTCNRFVYFRCSELTTRETILRGDVSS